MAAQNITAQQAIQNARQAILNNDRRTARRWAEIAAVLAPDLEDPWLLLASLASPRASIAYLNRALQINPSSLRARKGMRWVRQRLQKDLRPAPIAVAPVTPPKNKRSQLIFLVAILLMAWLWLALPGQLTALAQIMPRVIQPVMDIGTASTATLLPVIPNWTSLPGAFPTGTALPALATATATTLPAATSLADTIPATASPAAAVTDVSTQFANLTPLLAPSETPSPDATMETVPGPTATPSDGIYIVQPGDTLNKIAARFGTSALALADYNNISINSIIHSGQRLNIPGAADLVSTNEPAAITPAGTGKRILVDISEQHLYAYDGETLIYSFVASTGMNNATRVGTFAVQSKIPNAYGSTWNIWMPNWLGIYWAGSLENGIHALPILPNGQILWAGYLGTPVSYGCVVLGTFESGLLYDWAEMGTPVIIQW